jgi:hypothetical protein
MGTTPTNIDNKRLVQKVGVADSNIAEKVRENLKVVLDLD